MDREQFETDVETGSKVVGGFSLAHPVFVAFIIGFVLGYIVKLIA